MLLSSVSLLPTDDAYVRSGTYANTAFGADATGKFTLTVKTHDTDPDATRRAYLKFDVSTLPAVVSAELLLTGYVNGTGTTILVNGLAGTTNSWDESTVTWNNKPSFGAFQDSDYVSGTALDQYDWTVTGHVRAQQQAGQAATLGLRAVDATDPAALFKSKEGGTGSERPTLVVTTLLTPTGLAAGTPTYSGSTASVPLTWADASDNETGFKVERSDDGGTTWSTLTSSLAAGTTAYTDTSAVPSAVYKYRVKSVVSGVVDSKPSNVVSATTPPGVVTGTVWADVNNNGTRDTGEPGLPDRQVYLDANDNGSFEDTESLVATDETGAYAFGDLALNATYKVRAYDTWAGQSSPTGGASRSATPTTATPVCTGNDFGLIPPAPSITVVAGADAQEDYLENGSFTVVRDQFDLSQPLTVSYTVGGTATNGTDYTSLSGSVVIPAGESSVDVPVAPTNDTAVEADETVVLTVAAGTGYTIQPGATATITLSNLDGILPEVTVITPAYVATEAGPVPGLFTVTRASHDISQSLVVSYAITGTATNGTDYSSLSGSVTIPAGQTTADIAVSPVADGVTETKETVVLTLSGTSGYTLGELVSGTVALSDIALPDVTVETASGAASESGPVAATFTVTRTGGDLTQPLTVAYTTAGTATAGTDYGTPGGTVTIPANAASATVTLTPINDLDAEGEESIFLTLTDGPSYNPAPGVGAYATIEDNDFSTALTSGGPTIFNELGVAYPSTKTVWGGQALHFRAFPSTSKNPDGSDFSQDPAVSNGLMFNTTYQWTFNDPGTSLQHINGEFDSRLNTTQGYNAAHMWDSPPSGQTYTRSVTLTINPDLPNPASRSRTITVYVRNPLNEGFKAIYVDNTRPDDSSKDPSNSATPIKTLGKLNALLSSTTGPYKDGNILVRFKVGQTFPSSWTQSQLFNVTKNNVIFDWYGESQTAKSVRPTLFDDNRTNAIGRNFFNVSSNNVTIRHLRFADFDSNTPDNLEPRERAPRVVVGDGARNLTLVDLTLDHVSHGVTINANSNATGVLIQKMRQLDYEDLRYNLAYFQGSHLVVQGNMLPGSTSEPVIRTMGPTTSFVQIVRNSFTMRSNHPKDGISARYGSHMFIWENDMKWARIQVGDTDAFATTPPNMARWVNVLTNRVSHTQPGNAAINVDYRAKHVHLADNTIKMASSDCWAFALGGSGFSGNLIVNANKVYNNYTGAGTADFLRLADDGAPGIVVVYNQYIVASRSSWTGYNLRMLEGTQPSAFASVYGNTWDRKAVGAPVYATTRDGGRKVTPWYESTFPNNSFRP